MSVATVITGGFGTFGSNNFVVTEGFGDYGGAPPVVSTHSPYYFEFSEYAETKRIDPMERIRARIAQDNEDIILILMSIVDKL